MMASKFHHEKFNSPRANAFSFYRPSGLQVVGLFAVLRDVQTFDHFVS